MTNNTTIQLEFKRRLGALLSEIHDVELLQALDSVHNLQPLLDRLSTLYAGETIAVIGQIQFAWDDLIEVITLKLHKNKTNRKALQNWENEGGMVDYPSNEQHRFTD